MIKNQATILVVDDELFFRKLYRDLLSDEGHQVEVCENGEDAIQRLRQGGIDLILTDMVMPGQSGLEVLRAARAEANPPEVILATGFASLETAIHSLKSGARDYLVKPFNPDELKHQVRTCLEQRQLLEENEQLKKQIQLYQTGQALSSLIDLGRLLPQALDALLRQLDAQQGFVFSVEAKGEIRLGALQNLESNSAETVAKMLQPRIHVAAGLSQPATLLTAELLEEGLNSGRVWVLPLGDSQELKGGVVVCDGPEDVVGQLPQADLNFLCDQIALGFENSCRYQDAQELMYTDDLTGLYNHRYMEVVLEHEIRRSQRYGLQFSLLFMDLDRFKQINDTHGHLAGSAALQEIGCLLRGCVRDVDTLFRYGGDEFAAILVETDSQTAQVVAERIRKAIAEHLFLQEQKIFSRLTTTTGYATFPIDATEPKDLLALADKAMYAGKISRNVVRGAAEIPEQ